jgi:fructokinase
MNNTPLIHVFGEVLFDHFQDGSSVLGGAPFNVAWHLQAFGLPPRFISRIGVDPAGAEIAALMDDWGITQTALQTDHEHPTGSVQVLIENGEPHYDFVPDSAYDFIDGDLLDEQHTQGILYHGSLALRNPISRAALQAVKAQHQGAIFVDVNLRSPWSEPETLRTLLHDAAWVKLNEAELAELGSGNADLETDMQAFCAEFDLKTLIVTRGEKGAVAYDRQLKLVTVKPPALTPVVDTVGAGDAFAALLLVGLSKQWPLELTLERAQAFACALVGRRGATVVDRAFYRVFREQWD